MREETHSPGELCQRCGICCDGTLFSRVPLTPTEAKVLEGRGLELARRRNGERSLPLACQALDGCRCTIYEDRPGSCRAFVCALYKAVEAGTVGFDDAMARVEETKAMRLDAVDRKLDEHLKRHFGF